MDDHKTLEDSPADVRAIWLEILMEAASAIGAIEWDEDDD